MRFAYNTCFAIVSFAIAATASSASTFIPQPRFDGISITGGGQVIVKRGPSHNVRIVRGDPAALEITSTRQSGLSIRCRPNACRHFTPRVEVTTPFVSALAINGGGYMLVERGFGPQRDLALSVRGGGQIDTTALAASKVAASISGGGKIETRAGASLAASVRGGGAISYYGTPQMATSIQGGGAVHHAGSSGAKHD